MIRVVLTSFVIGLALALATDKTYGQHSFGLSGGLGMATVVEGQPAWFDYDVVYGLALGLMFESAEWSRIAVRTGLQYVEQGSQRTFHGIDEGSIKLGYIRSPLLIKVRILPGKFYPYIVGGPYGAYLMRSTLHYRGDVAALVDYTRTFDFGVTVGGGIGSSWRRKHVFVELNVNTGLSSVGRNVEVLTFRNSSVHLLTGMMFHF